MKISEIYQKSITVLYNDKLLIPAKTRNTSEGPSFHAVYSKNYFQLDLGLKL